MGQEAGPSPTRSPRRSVRIGTHTHRRRKDLSSSRGFSDLIRVVPERGKALYFRGGQVLDMPIAIRGSEVSRKGPRSKGLWGEWFALNEVSSPLKRRRRSLKTWLSVVGSGCVRPLINSPPAGESFELEKEPTKHTPLTRSSEKIRSDK